LLVDSAGGGQESLVFSHSSVAVSRLGPGSTSGIFAALRRAGKKGFNRGFPPKAGHGAKLFATGGRKAGSSAWCIIYLMIRTLLRPLLSISEQ